MRISRLALLILASGLALGSRPASALNPPEGDAVVTIRQTDERKFPEITLDFEVKTPAGEPILDATRGDFRVEEYDSPVVITGFRSPISKEFRPTTVVLVLDRSGSMLKEDRIGGLKRAVASFLENQPKGSRVAVVAFGDEVELICPFTDDPRKVRLSVGDLVPAGQTRFFDAVSVALRLLAGEPGRRAVLAMTDGEDNFSRDADPESVLRDARREGVPVHTLALGSEGEIGAEGLRNLARLTRGQAFTARRANELGAIFEEIALSLGRSYSLTYRSDRRLQDGTLRPIRVYYRKSTKAGEAEVYIPGMVVPAAGWSWLFLLLVAGLGAMAALPGWSRR